MYLQTSTLRDCTGNLSQSAAAQKAGMMLMGVNGIGMLCIAADYMGINRKWARNVSRWTLGVFMIAAGAAHFDPKMMDFYMRIMPSFLPFQRELIYLGGVIEMTAGLLSLVPATKNIGGYLTMATLVSLFPVNIYMAMSEQSQRSVGATQIGLLNGYAIMMGMAAIYVDRKQSPIEDITYL